MLIIAGDQHEDEEYARQVLALADEVGAIGTVFLGDGGLWPDLRWVNSLRANAPVYLVRGNHEHQDFTRQFQIGRLHELRENVFFAADGATLPTKMGLVGFFGGAVSVDADRRVEGETVWKDLEGPMEDAVALLANRPVELLLTHDAPELPPRVSALSKAPCVASRELVRSAMTACSPTFLVHGHYHERYSSQIEGTTVVGLGANFSRLETAVVGWDGAQVIHGCLLV